VEPERALGQYEVTESGLARTTASAPEYTSGPHRTASADWLELDVGNRAPLFVPGDASRLDLTSYHFGRTGAAFPSTRTPVHVELSGLDWNDGASLQLVTPNLGLSIHELETHFASPPVGGATSISGETIDWARAGAPLLDSSQGDVTWLAQMTTTRRELGGYYSVLTHAGVARGLTQVDGATATLAAKLAPVALDHTLDLRWRGTAYAALAAEAGPYTRAAAGPTLSLHTLPDAIAHNNAYHASLYQYLPSLVDFGPMDGRADFAQTIHYGNPFSTPANKWSEMVTMVYSMPVVIPHVGSMNAMLVQAVPVDAAARSVELAPAISPVRDVAINGASLAEPRTGVGRTPVITWSAPSLGTATTYSIEVEAIVRSGPGFMLRPVGTFMTNTTSLTLPAIDATSATSYVLTISAIATGDRDLATTPFLGTLPFASADYVTAQITP
jgi:hypothetical protein